MFPSDGKCCISLSTELIYLGSIYFCYEKGGFSIRSSRPEAFCKKGVLRNFAKFTGKHLCHSLFFNKVAPKVRPIT